MTDLKDENIETEIEENCEEDYDNIKKNKLVILNSLSNCIIKYIELSNIDYEKADEIENNIINEEKKILNHMKDEDKIYRIFQKKLEKLKIKEYYGKKIKKNMIYNIFILENILEIMIHSLKNLQIEPKKAYEKIKYLLSNFHIGNSIEKNKMLFYQILYIMNKCFKSFLIIQNISLDYDKNSDENYIKYDIDDNDKIFYEKERYYNFENDLCIIKNDVLKLLNKYKQFDFDSIKIESQFNDKEANIKKELLILIVLNYQIIFYLINCNLINLSQFEYILYINNNYNNMKKTQLLIDMIFMHRKKRLIILFSFLQKINDFLEITIYDNNLFLINLIKPEYLNISKNTEYYFHSLIDYSSPESKLMTIYNFLECIMYDINRNHWKNNESCFSKILFYNQNHWTL